MLIAMVRVGTEGGLQTTFPLCDLKTEDRVEALSRLRAMLEREDINVTDFCSGYLKHQDALYYVQHVGPSADLPRMLAAVRILQKREDMSRESFAKFLQTCS